MIFHLITKPTALVPQTNNNQQLWSLEHMHGVSWVYNLSRISQSVCVSVFLFPPFWVIPQLEAVMMTMFYTLGYQNRALRTVWPISWLGKFQVGLQLRLSLLHATGDFTAITRLLLFVQMHYLSLMFFGIELETSCALKYIEVCSNYRSKDWCITERWALYLLLRYKPIFL